jgi:hypothetical protein
LDILCSETGITVTLPSAWTTRTIILSTFRPHQAHVEDAARKRTWMNGETVRDSTIRGCRNDNGRKRIASLEKLTEFLSFQAFGRQQEVIDEDVKASIAIPAGVGDRKLGGTRAVQIECVLKPAAVAPAAALKLA